MVWQPWSDAVSELHWSLAWRDVSVAAVARRQSIGGRADCYVGKEVVERLFCPMRQDKVQSCGTQAWDCLSILSAGFKVEVVEEQSVHISLW